MMSILMPFKDRRSHPRVPGKNKKNSGPFLNKIQACKVPTNYFLVGLLVLLITVGNGRFSGSWLPNPIYIFTAANKWAGISYLDTQ